MTREGTKEAAEAVLRELPSVIGACVREDVHGHPREIHLLVKAGPNPRHLAYDVRDLLEERLGIPVDQRVISIAQLAPGKEPAAFRRSGSGAAAAEAISLARGSEPAGQPVAEEQAAEPEARVRFHGISMEAMDNRVRIRISLQLGEREYRGDAMGLDTAQARARTAAAATLQAVDATCVGRARFEVEQVSQVRAFERDYILVNVLVSSPYLGRKPIPLVAAQPVEVDTESAAAYAALKAVNRTLSLVLRLAEGGQGGGRGRGRRG